MGNGRHLLRFHWNWISVLTVDPVLSVRVRNQVLASFGGAGAVMEVALMTAGTVIQLRAERGLVSVV